MTAIVFGTVMPWVLLLLGTWLGFQLVRQNGRILLRLESIEKRLSPRTAGKSREAAGLSVGTLAPEFELPDLTGIRHKLSAFRGRDVLLIFFNPDCGYCTKMAADLAALPLEGGQNRAVPIVVTTGDLDKNRKLVEQFGIRGTVLLQEQMEIASQYHAQGTPMGYRIDGTGRIASELTVGAEKLLQLAERIPTSHIAPHGSVNGSKPPGVKDYKSLAATRLNRKGLKSGAAAPDFRLPRTDGGDLSLADFRGRRVLLVFSDPECGPCDALAPRLQQIHTRRSDLQVLVVSRRDVETNREKAVRLGLTFPIVVQRQWEVSLLYAMFATPVGYLIDERGALASDVAVGVESILALVDEGLPESLDTAESLAREQEHAWAVG